MSVGSTASPKLTGPRRLKIRYVLAVWGSTYIERYFDFTFATHLASGNLPAVADRADLSFAILTRAGEFETFARQPLFGRLQALGPVEFIDIEDLISHPGVFTVTLTLAFTRALRAAGPAATGINFLFMNADFMLADGTLSTVVDRLEAGAQAVVTATPRAVAEALTPMIAGQRRQPDGALAMSPRQMVALALSAPHMMVSAKQPEARMLHTIVPNQFFWRIDQDTLLARSFLVFMLALRPSRIYYRATSYCDYTMISDLVGDGPISAIADSDDGFILELQSERQEVNAVRLGPMRDAQVAAHLAEWTTRHHRDVARFEFVFHSGDLPAALGTASTRAAAYIDRIVRQLPPPVEGRAHPYWVSGLSAWRLHHPTQRLPEEVEVAYSKAALAAPGSTSVQSPLRRRRQDPLTALVALVFHRAYPRSEPIRRRWRVPPSVTDLSPVVAALTTLAPGGQVAVYGDAPHVLLQAVARQHVVRRDLSHMRPDATRPGPSTVATLIRIESDGLGLLEQAFATAHSQAAAGGVAVLLLGNNGRDPTDVRFAIIDAIIHLPSQSLTYVHDIIDRAPEQTAAERALRDVIWQMHEEVTLPRAARTASLAAQTIGHRAMQSLLARRARRGLSGWFEGVTILFRR